MDGAPRFSLGGGGCVGAASSRQARRETSGASIFTRPPVVGRGAQEALVHPGRCARLAGELPPPALGAAKRRSLADRQRFACSSRCAPVDTRFVGGPTSPSPSARRPTLAYHAAARANASKLPANPFAFLAEMSDERIRRMQEQLLHYRWAMAYRRPAAPSAVHSIAQELQEHVSQNPVRQNVFNVIYFHMLHATAHATRATNTRPRPTRRGRGRPAPSRRRRAPTCRSTRTPG